MAPYQLYIYYLLMMSWCTWSSSLSSLISKRFQSDDGLIGDDGMAARPYPEHWKGENGLYCAGLARRGIYGSYSDAELIAGDISELLRPQQTHSNGSK